MDEAQVGEGRAAVVLEEERGGVEEVEGDAVGEFGGGEGGLLGEDGVDVGGEEGVGLEEGGAEAALDGGLYFCLWAGGDVPVVVSIRFGGGE